MKSIIAIIAALALSALVSAQGSILSVTSPLNGTVFTAGAPVFITWSQPTVDVISQIVLAHGDPSNLQMDGPIASNVPAAALSYTWDIPATTAQGVYALIFGTAPNVAYSPQFIIQPAVGASSITSAAPGGASVPVPEPASSASSSEASAVTNDGSDLVSATSSSFSSPSVSQGFAHSGAVHIHNAPAVGMIALGITAVAAVAAML